MAQLGEVPTLQGRSSASRARALGTRVVSPAPPVREGAGEETLQGDAE